MLEDLLRHDEVARAIGKGNRESVGDRVELGVIPSGMPDAPVYRDVPRMLQARAQLGLAGTEIEHDRPGRHGFDARDEFAPAAPEDGIAVPPAPHPAAEESLVEHADRAHLFAASS